MTVSQVLAIGAGFSWVMGVVRFIKTEYDASAKWLLSTLTFCVLAVLFL